MQYLTDLFRKTTLPLICLGIHTGSSAQTDIDILWAKGIISERSASVSCMKRDIMGNIYLSGTFAGTTDFDPGPGISNLTNSGAENDIFIAKYDASGNYLWAGRIGGGINAWSNAIEVDSHGDLYMTGSFTGTTDFDPGPGTTNLLNMGYQDMFIAKYDASGNLLWAKRIGGDPYCRSSDLALDQDENLYITGFFVHYLDLDPGVGLNILTSAGSYDAFIAKYSPSGGHLWSASIGGPGVDFGNGIAVLKNGHFILTGNFSETADFDPGPGTSFLTSTEFSNIFMAEYDESGNHIWSKGLSGSFALGYTINVDGDGNILLSGIYGESPDFDPGPGIATLTPQGDENVFVSKYDASGNHLWVLGIGGNPLYITDRPVAIDQYGAVYMTGYFEGTADFDPGPGVSNLTSEGSSDVFLVKYDRFGNFVWCKRMGRTSSDGGIDIFHDRINKLYLIGYFSGTVDFDPGPGSLELSSNPWTESAFIAVYSTAATKTWIGGDGNWSTPANWSDGMAPNSEDILTVTNGNPRLDIDFTVAGSLTLSGTGALTVQPGKTLTVSGTADFGARPVVFQSNPSGTAQLGTVSGTLDNANNVTVERYIPNTGRRWRLLTAPLENLTLNAAWQNGQTWNGAVPFAGDGTGTLITGQQQGNASTANGRGFDFWSAIANSSASVMSYTQRSGQGTWSPMANTTWSNAFNSDPAYLLFVRGPRSSTYSTGTSNAGTTLRPTGSLKQGERNIPVDGTKGYTLIGNPYPSQIDFNALYLENGNSSVIKRQLWMWDATAGTSGNFQAVVYSGGKYVEVPTKFHGPGQASPLTAIQSGHGFFVQPLTPSGGTLKILEKHKLTLQPALPNILLSGDTTPRLWLNLARKFTDGSILTADGLMVAYGDTYRMETTDADDALKLENIQENLAILNDGASLTADARPISKMNEQIRLRAWNLNSGGYRFEAKIEGMEDRGINAFLEDRHKGTRTPLKMDGDITSIDLTVGEDHTSRAEDRFRIVFERTAVNALSTPEADGEGRTMTVYPNPVTGRTLNVRLQNLPAGEYTLQLVGSDGRVVATKKVRHDEGASVHRIELNGILPKGAYQVVCLLGHDRVDTKKLIAK